jgi:PAS domain-containing protein
MDSIGILRANYWGYSMGGWIGFGTAMEARARLRAIIIGGQDPYGRKMLPGPDGSDAREFITLFAMGISEVPRLILFCITSFFVAFVVSAQRKATENLRRSGSDLQEAMNSQKRIEAALLHSEMYLTAAQRLSRTGSFGWNVASGDIFWSDETFRIFQYDRAAKPTVELIVQRTHPEDRAAVQETMDLASGEGKDFDHEYRLLMPDSSIKYVHAVARAARDVSGGIEFLGAVTDVTAAKETERKLRRSEAYLAETQHLSHTSSWAWDVRRREWAYRSAESYYLFGFDPLKGPVPLQAFRDRILPEDRLRNFEAASQAIRERTDFEVDFRIALPDGSIRRIYSVGRPVVGSDGEVIELVGTHVEVTGQYAAKEALQKAFDEIKKSEDHLRLVIDTIPTLLWRAGPGGIPDFLNQPALDYTGLSLDQVETGWPRAFHPDDKKGMLVKWSAIRGSVCEAGLNLGSSALMVNIAGICSKPNRCAMSRATLSNGTGRPPTSRTASGRRWHFARASSAFVTMPKLLPTGSGRPDGTTGSPRYRRTSMLVASRPHAYWAWRAGRLRPILNRSPKNGDCIGRCSTHIGHFAISCTRSTIG